MASHICTHVSANVNTQRLANKNIFCQEIVSEILQEMTWRDINMGTKQFLKDIRREQQIKKTAAHRQMVMTRKQKKERKDAKVTLDEMRSDKSPGRITSHQEITAVIAKFGKGATSSPGSSHFSKWRRLGTRPWHTADHMSPTRMEMYSKWRLRRKGWEELGTRC